MTLTSLVGKPDFRFNLDRCGDLLGNPDADRQARNGLVVRVLNNYMLIRDVVEPGGSFPTTFRVCGQGGQRLIGEWEGEDIVNGMSGPPDERRGP